MNRAHSTFVLKSASEPRREFEGWCSTPTVDRQGDEVLPSGARIKTPLPLLWEHDLRSPIGHVISAKATAAGIWITGKIPKIATPGKVRDRANEVWTLVAERLVKHLSIGFRSIGKPTPIATGLRYDAFELLEVSICSVPANAGAEIQVVRAADQQSLRAAALASAGRRPDCVYLDEPAGSSRFRDPNRGAVYINKPRRKFRVDPQHKGSVFLDPPDRSVGSFDRD